MSITASSAVRQLLSADEIERVAHEVLDVAVENGLGTAGKKHFEGRYRLACGVRIVIGINWMPDEQHEIRIGLPHQMRMEAGDGQNRGSGRMT